jgi:hypothetical protein
MMGGALVHATSSYAMIESRLDGLRYVSHEGGHKRFNTTRDKPRQSRPVSPAL